MALTEERETAIPRAKRTPVASRLTGDFLAVLLLFVFFRLMAIILFRPGGYLLQGYFDHGFYNSFAELSARGYFPYLHYWLEYPPLFAWTLVGAYQLATLLPPVGDGFFWFHIVVSLMLVLAETGNLVLVYLTALEMHDRTTALRCAWMYALLFTPLYALLGTFESYPLFFLLLGLYLAMKRRPWLAGIVTGWGFMVKLLPAMVVPVAWHALGVHRRRLAYLLAAAATVAAVALPFWLLNGTFFLASFRAMLVRSSWETVWALLEGYFSFGKVAPIADRFLPETAAWQSHPSTLPWLWIAAPFAALYALLWTRRFEWGGARALVALAGITVDLAFLASKGYSTQFLVYLLPFIVLLLPDVRGVAYAALLGVADFVEGVLIFAFFPDQPWLLVATVVGRTLLWMLLGLEYLAVLVPKFGLTWERFAQVSRRPGLALAVAAPLGGLALLPVLLAPTARGYAEVGQLLQGQGREEQAIVLANRESYYALRRYMPQGTFWLPTAKAGSSTEEMEADLAEFLRGRARAWLLIDRDRGEGPQGAAVRYWLDWNGTLLGTRWLEGLELRDYRFPATGDPALRVGHRVGASFGSLEMIGYDLVPAETTPGEPFRVILYWRASGPAAADYHTFVHLVSPAQRSFGNGDRPLVDERGRPPTQWAAGQLVRQGYEVKAVPGTPPGEYRLEVGLYDARSGARVPVTGGGEAGLTDRVLLSGITLRGGPWTQLEAQHRLNASFGGRALLAGYDVAGQPAPGGSLAVTLYWRGLRPIQEDYTVFLHLVDGEGRIRAQQDSPPGDGYYPTSRWQDGGLVRDTHDVALPPDLPPGGYQLRAGLYLPASGQRLGVRDDAGDAGGDYVDLGEVNVASR